VRPLTDTDQASRDDLLVREWGGPLIGLDHIPLRDEIELAKRLN